MRPTCSSTHLLLLAVLLGACVDSARDRGGASRVAEPSVARGLALVEHTPDSLPAFARANLRCTSCHLDRGTRTDAASLVGVTARYPAYVARAGRDASIQERVNFCFTRSLAGNPLSTDGRDMADIVAYLTSLTRAPGARPFRTGMPAMPPLVGDSTRGAPIFAGTCVRCHGADGEGTVVAPALWGARSYSIGASMARIERAASFIRHNMPLDAPGSLSDQQAYDVAAFVDSHARPDLPHKEADWPRGGAPADVPYATPGHPAHRPPPLLPSLQRSTSSSSREVAAGGAPRAVTASDRR